MTARERAVAGFRAHFGHEPDDVSFAPGRVNLIGEHVDYNDGLVLPMPITVGTAVAWSRSTAATIDAVALDLKSTDSFVPGGPTVHQPPDWRSYLRGTAAELGGRGFDAVPARLAIAGDIPRGTGLSSSASFCVATGRALAAAANHAPTAVQLAQAAQAAEHVWAGVRCGIMDQMAVAAGQPGHALLLDCRTLVTRDAPWPSDWAVMIVQSGVHRGLIDGHYNQRRRECEAAAQALGVGSLRDATAAMVAAAAMTEVLMRRARHVVSEIDRTAAAVAAIAAHDLPQLGVLLAASHASLRDDFEVSVPPVDALVAKVQQAIGSAGGVRMTGGGFGGAIVAVMSVDAVPEVADAAARAIGMAHPVAPAIIIERAARSG